MLYVFNDFIELLIVHSMISILYLVTECLFSNVIFIQWFVCYSIIIKSFYNLHFHSVLFSIINQFHQINCFHLVFECSVNNSKLICSRFAFSFNLKFCICSHEGHLISWFLPAKIVEKYMCLAQSNNFFLKIATNLNRSLKLYQKDVTINSVIQRDSVALV